MQAYAAKADRLADCLLLNQATTCKLLLNNTILLVRLLQVWQISHK